jgi:predicted O-methyltransferase YrrM
MEWYEQPPDWRMNRILRLLKYKRREPRARRLLLLTLCQRYRRISRQRGAEIGVERGGSAAMLLEFLPRLHLTMVDIWRPVHRGTTKGNQAHHDGNLIETLHRVRPYRDRCTVLWRESVSAAATVPDGKLDWVYLDADHRYDSVARDLAVWWPKLKHGGLLCGDDYNARMERQFGRWGVARAVDEFAHERRLTVRSKPPSFYFIEKP